MRKVWLLASAVLAFLNFVKSQELARTLYSPRYDNLDIDTILASNRLVSNYVDCLLSRKPCPPEGKDLKRILPEALRTKCARCSPTQKENALKIITRLYYDYPDQYRALRERWDPSGEYHRRFEEYLRGLQFNQIGGSGGGGGTGGGTGAVAGGNGGGGNTVQTGGNDRPVRNDLDRQPATQSSNVQSVVIDPAQQLGQQASGTVNTPTAAIPSSFPPAVAPATERPRPPAPAPPAPPVLVNRFGEDADPVRPTIAAPAPVTTTTTRRPTTTVRQTRPVTRQTSTTRNTQRTTTRFITRVPPTPPPTPRWTPTTSTTTTMTPTTKLPQRLPPPPPPPPQPSPGQQQQPLYPQAPPPQVYPPIVYQQQPPRVQPATITTTTTTTTARPLYVPSYRPGPTEFNVPSPQYGGGTTPDSIIDHFFVPPSQQAANAPLPAASPIVGLWNQLGTKIADTADAIAGMLKKTVDVLVTSHIQSHQRALRGI
ncbi:mucin-2-like isoform X1 [Anopheles aquasalis]|uniref:mucin-2-like isoform X1 n=1 Tax=Anopheles aquasalis TaxID=42839 RepID=UPI00215A0D8E|nr:mucin-2-like isoform X1 [Anopheles aquasalis]XP_050101582.1 mucin-2-like isoform X1 [Anopheles aquasalis]XP_050101583.1 mucin-2-like isoform X1 [Anopheles aquasalis]XP_050101584.1 mucin-2-like isoform X1 [Anopheles aquasalis]